jgi:hypothetical protein
MNDMITHEVDRSYERLSTQADKIRQAIRWHNQAHDLIPRTLLVTSANDALDWIDDDFAKLIGKLKMALARIDELLDEMEQ